MLWYLAGLALSLHVYCWGAGAAVLLLPRRLERLWLLFAPVAGLSLQSLVVYLSGFTAVRGANAYGRWSLLIPLALAAWAGWRRGRAGSLDLGRSALRCWPGVAVQIVVLVLLLTPLARSGAGLTSMSLGSSDAADYAAGVRVFQEFSADDHTGFLGQVDGVKLGDVERFRGHWMRLNHFGPPAVMALNAAVLGWRAHEIVSLFTAMLPVFLVPVVTLVARGVFRCGGGGALVLGALVALSPLTEYAVYHVATGQLMGTLSACVITWSSFRAVDLAVAWRGLWQWTGVLICGVWLLTGSYTFMLLVVFVPVLGWTGLRCIRARSFLPRAWRWGVWCLASVVFVAAMFPARVIGLRQRFELFARYDIGWPVPGLRPAGWLGVVHAPDLSVAHGWIAAGGWVVVAGTVAAFAFWRRRRNAWLCLSMSVAPLIGYAWLLMESVRLKNNESYDAYKLLCFFLPLVIGGMCPWLAWRRTCDPLRRVLGGSLAALLIGVNIAAAAPFRSIMRHPPLIVDPALVRLGEIENLAGVDALNMRVGQFWSRLWANAFLLRKEQFFATYTYEGRQPTPQRAHFDLADNFVRVRGADDLYVFESPLYVVVNRRSRFFVDATFSASWFEPERYRGSMWRWSGERPEIVLENPGGALRHVRLEVDWRAAGPRQCAILFNGSEIWRGAVGLDRSHVVTRDLSIEAGRNVLVIDSPTPATPAPAGDPRKLLVALFGLTIDVVSKPEAASPP